MFFKKQVIQTENKPEGYDYFSKMYFAKKAHEFCDELNTLHVLLTLGITKHYDCGIVGENYIDVVFLGPLKKEFRFNVVEIMSTDNPQRKRYDMLKVSIAEWHKRLLSLYEENGETV